MKSVRSGAGWLPSLIVATVMAGSASDVAAQATMMPSTLRHGSGYLDVPSASVIPHLAVLGTFSNMWVSTGQTLLVDGQGATVGIDADGREDSFGNASVALGLFDRVEVGATLQSFNDNDQGGNIVGAFGQVALLRPQETGIGFAVGLRYVQAPDFEGQTGAWQPNRLGFPDDRFVETLRDPGDLDGDISTQVTFYGVATAFLRGMNVDWLPEHDWTFSGGWGQGMFSEGEEVDFYSFADSEGVFGGGSLNLAITETSVLRLMGEWNGFDVNIGAQVDFGGFRIGGHYLGANYQQDIDIYRSAKFGVLGSVALCLDGDSLMCRPGMLEREVMSDTIRLPAPPPDTVVVDREVAPPLPTGTPAQICLATGQTAQVVVTAQGDTLVGPNRVSVRTLRPGIVFAGSYAAGADWFENDEAVTYEDTEYQKSGGEVSLDCASIMQVGVHMGVPLFAERSAERPFQTLYAPVRPGVWQGYERGLRSTRGDGAL